MDARAPIDGDQAPADRLFERAPGPEAVRADARPSDVPAPGADVTPVAPAPVAEAPHAAAAPIAAAPLAAAVPASAPAGDPTSGFAEGPDGPRCTTAQLRRFIKSRPWVPMHELRRRFAIWGADDDVSPMRVGDRTLFIGLPPSEARMMTELLAGGDVGYELSLDPTSPIVVGVYPMRPVPRS